MPVRIVVWSGIAHREVEEAIRPEVQTPPAVILGDTLDFNQFPGLPPRVRREVIIENLLHNPSRHLPLFNYLKIEIVFSVFTKLRMEANIQ